MKWKSVNVMQNIEGVSDTPRHLGTSRAGNQISCLEHRLVGNTVRMLKEDFQLFEVW